MTPGAGKTDERNIIIIEGGNYSGKSIFMDDLKKIFTGSTVIEIHDYYHKQEMRYRRHISTYLEDLISYNMRRINRFVNHMEEDALDTFLVERMHGTDYVYKRLLYGVDNFDVYRDIEERLNSLDASMVLLTVDDDVLEQRMKSTKKIRRIKANSTTPLHIIKLDEMRKKRDMYLDFYTKSQISKKLLVQSTNNTDNFEVISELKRL